MSLSSRLSAGVQRRITGRSHGVAAARDPWADGDPTQYKAEPDCGRCDGTGWKPATEKLPERICDCARPTVHSLPLSPYQRAIDQSRDEAA